MLVIQIWSGDLRGFGYKIISAKYIANQFHLFHKRKNGIFERGMLEKLKKIKKIKNFPVL